MRQWCATSDELLDLQHWGHPHPRLGRTVHHGPHRRHAHRQRIGHGLRTQRHPLRPHRAHGSGERRREHLVRVRGCRRTDQRHHQVFRRRPCPLGRRLWDHVGGSHRRRRRVGPAPRQGPGTSWRERLSLRATRGPQRRPIHRHAASGPGVVVQHLERRPRKRSRHDAGRPVHLRGPVRGRCELGRGGASWRF